MCRTDVQYDADLRRRDATEIRNVPRAARAVLADERARLLGDREHRERQAELVVERALGRHRWTGDRERLREQVLGRRLARRARDADDGAPRRATQHTGRKLTQRM